MTTTTMRANPRMPHEGDVLAYRSAETRAARRELARECREWHANMISAAVVGGYFDREHTAADLHAWAVWTRLLRLHTLRSIADAAAGVR